MHTHIYTYVYIYSAIEAATIYVSPYCYICVLILLYVCPHTAIYVSSYCCICVLILLYMCPHSATYCCSGCRWFCGSVWERQCAQRAPRRGCMQVSYYYFVCQLLVKPNLLLIQYLIYCRRCRRRRRRAIRACGAPRKRKRKRKRK